MEAVGNMFSRSIQHTIEEEGILAFDVCPTKYAAVYNMDQTAIYIDMNGRTTIEFVGAPTVDVLQGSAVNGFRTTVFLAASATGHKLPPLIVYASVPGARVAAEVWDPAFGAEDVEHTVQRKAFCDERVMLEWIERIWKPSVTGCRLLLLDSLKTHKMASVRYVLQEECCTEVEFVPPGITGISQPMDVAVMKAFKDHVRSFYLEHHMENDFPRTPQEKWALISRIVAAAWNAIPNEVIVKGFIKAGIIPVGPRDASGRFRIPSVDSADAPVICAEE
ncbi:hypothetical protein PR003_g19901 [Phytophthora rubi]|uniref:DDE-1 domain-containing protein n=1 Tax=Phytophthora rubi TaxID=129364 RepID=A0A6A4DRN6_9STRA|nr:hypothetical protein PR002_g19185 [Phytophthora rubi]KAE9000562.1 hypothetical protein PR001_g18758 [Phytophthora rubi]KAE9311902.1 hypothetical protein PR003_g19901 [Phytophthora rubi]